MRVFVTGATGFVGSYVAKQLLARGDEVVALARDQEAARPLAYLGAELHLGDITKKESLRSGMQGVDALFHIAGWYKVGVDDVETAYAVNVEGTRNVLELMRDLQIPRGVYTSTLAVNSDTNGEVKDESYRFEGEHLSLYDRTKWLAHHEVAEPMIAAGLPLAIVMPGAIYGPGDTSSTGDAFRDYLTGELPMLPRKTTVCWAHVEDIAEAHLLALEKGRPGETYIISGPCHTLIEAFEIAESITGIPAPKFRLPPWLLKAMSVPMGVVDPFLPLPPEYTGEALRVLAGVTYLGTHAKARNELGYKPRSLEDGLRESLPSYGNDVAAGE